MPVPRWTRWLTAPFLAGILVTISAPPGLCYWSRGGTQVSGLPGAEDPALVPDASGGTIVVWSRGQIQVLAQRLNPLGEPQWHAGGIEVSSAPVREVASAIPDGAGGCFVVFKAQTSPESVYAQRVDANGARLWGSRGASVASLPSKSFFYLQAVSDGADGILVGWGDLYNPASDVYVQHLVGSGARAPGWPASGVLVATGTARQDFHGVVDDGAGGAYVTWSEGPNGSGLSDVRIQRIGSDGAPSPGWPAIGIAVVEGGLTDNAQGMDLIRVGSDAVAYVSKYIGSQRALVLQRIAPDGFRLWGSSGVQYVGALHAFAEDLEPDGAGGVFASYRWYPGGVIPIGLSVHRLNAEGLFQWGPDGVEVGFGALDEFGSRLAQDGQGGLFVLWVDVSQGRHDLRVQHLIETGATQWLQGGVHVGGQGFPYSSYDYDPVPAPDGGVYVGWNTFDGSFSSDDLPEVRVQRILATGELGYALFAAPSSLAASDVPADEGGWVRLTLGAAPADRPDWDPYVTGYNVWRRIAPTPAPTAALRDVHELIARSQREVVRLSPSEAIAAGFPPGSWESLGFHGADGRATYELVASTRADSSAEETAAEEYVVASHLSVPGVVRVSEVVSTHSVDNLAPAAPDPFNGVYGSGNTLSWGPNREHDLLGYRLYRGTSHDFPLDATHRIYAGSATQFVDAGGGEADFYKLTAADRHGNEGEPSLVLPPGVAGVEPGPVALSLAVLGEMPSRRGTVDLEIRQRGNEAMTLEVLDLSGRSVERQSFVSAGGTTRCTIGGRASLRSGVYFVRVRSRAETALRRILITR